MTKTYLYVFTSDTAIPGLAIAAHRQERGRGQCWGDAAAVQRGSLQHDVPPQPFIYEDIGHAASLELCGTIWKTYYFQSRLVESVSIELGERSAELDRGMLLPTCSATDPADRIRAGSGTPGAEFPKHHR